MFVYVCVYIYIYRLFSLVEAVVLEAGGGDRDDLGWDRDSMLRSCFGLLGPGVPRASFSFRVFHMFRHLSLNNKPSWVAFLSR